MESVDSFSAFHSYFAYLAVNTKLRSAVFMIKVSDVKTVELTPIK